MRSLASKLTIALLSVGLLSILLVAIFTRRSALSAFDQFLVDEARAVFISEALAYYEIQQSWDGVFDHLRRTPPAMRGPGGGPMSHNAFLLTNNQGITLLPAGPFRRGQPVPEAELARGTAVISDGQTVGIVLAFLPFNSRQPNEQRYLDRTNQAVFLAAAGAGLLATLLAVVLARTINRPLKELKVAISAMSAGQLEQSVPVRSRDEVGELARAFNAMSARLAEANQLRRQMTADIAHDLRTPLTVISGYLESLRDGTLAATPERLDLIYNEARHLQHLVHDLRTLSLADAGELPLQLEATDPAQLLKRLSSFYQQQAAQAAVALQLDLQPALPNLRLDPQRMQQVLGNLINNALRHTPPGGEIWLRAFLSTAKTPHSQPRLVLCVADSGEGIPAEALPRIFDRFYRVDPARAQAQGESGLGLAIARSIIVAHGGQITVSSVPGQGTEFVISFPLDTPPAASAAAPAR